jgi:hypothetical protein
MLSYRNLCLFHLFRVRKTHILFLIDGFTHVRLYSSYSTGNSSDDPSLLNGSVPKIDNTSDDPSLLNGSVPKIDNTYDSDSDATFYIKYDTTISNESDECLYNSCCDGFFYKYVGKRHAIYSPAKGTQMLKDIFYLSWYRLDAIIQREYFSDPHPGLRVASISKAAIHVVIGVSLAI